MVITIEQHELQRLLVEAARQANTVAGEVQLLPMVWRINAAEARAYGKVATAATLEECARELESLDAVHQASAEDVRNAALEEAAHAIWLMRSRPEFEPDEYDKLLDRAMAAIRALKQPQAGNGGMPTEAQCKAAAEIARGFGARRLADVLDPPPADKDGGQQRAGSSVDLEAAAKTMAECMDYPWAHMPEQGRATMREFAQSVIRAALSATQPEQGERDEA